MKSFKHIALMLGAVTLVPAIAQAGDRTEYRTDADMDVDIELPYDNAQIDTFTEADLNKDGVVVFDEFQIFAQLNNEYNRFIVLDHNKDKRLSKNEFYSLDEAKDNYDGHK